MYFEEMKQGAAASSRVSEKSTFLLWTRLKEENPGWSKTELLQQFRAIVREDDGYYDDATLQLTTNFDTRLEGRRRRGRSWHQSREKFAADVKALKTKALKIIIAKFVWPNGKTTAECSGAYLIQCGGGATRIGKAIKPNQIAGKVLTEQQMQDLWDGK